MTNFEYIKTMNEEQFTDFMHDISLDRCWCPAKNDCGSYNSCDDAFIAWLKSECTCSDDKEEQYDHEWELTISHNDLDTIYYFECSKCGVKESMSMGI